MAGRPSGTANSTTTSLGGTGDSSSSSSRSRPNNKVNKSKRPLLVDREGDLVSLDSYLDNLVHSPGSPAPAEQQRLLSGNDSPSYSRLDSRGGASSKRRASSASSHGDEGLSFPHILVDKELPHDPEKLPGAVFRNFVIICGCVVIATMSGTPYCFNTYQDNIEADIKMSDVFVSAVSGVGLIGIYFVIVPGYCIDRFGVFKTTFIFMFFTAGGYIWMSFAHTPYELLVSFALTGIGSGATFMAVLSTAIMVSPTGGGLGVGVVSCAMSLSIAFTIKVLEGYAQIIKCSTCWRQYTFFLGVACGVVQVVAISSLLLFKKKNYSHLRGDDAASDSGEVTEASPSLNASKKTALSFVQSLNILTDPFFWVLFLTYFVGISSAIFIITNAAGLWLEYAPNENAIWSVNLLVYFSVANAAGNVVFGILSDYLHHKRILKHYQFVGAVMFVFALEFGGLGLAYTKKTVSPFVVLALLVLVGLSFGTYLVLVPVMVADAYGALNFGKCFSYMQIASSIASAVTPVLVTLLEAATKGYAVVFYVYGGVLLFTSLALLFLPVHHADEAGGGEGDDSSGGGEGAALLFPDFYGDEADEEPVLERREEVPRAAGPLSEANRTQSGGAGTLGVQPRPPPPSPIAASDSSSQSPSSRSGATSSPGPLRAAGQAPLAVGVESPSPLRRGKTKRKGVDEDTFASPLVSRSQGESAV